MKDEKGTGSFSTLRSALCTVVDGSRDATLRLEVIPLMIEIEGAQYGKCAHCLRWNPTDEMVWDNEALAWACCDPDCASR